MTEAPPAAALARRTGLRTVVSAYGTSLLSVFTILLGNFWLLRVVLENADPRSFGAYATVSQVTVLGGVLLLGLDSAVGIAIAQRLGVAAVVEATRVAWQLRRICRALAGAVAGVGALVAVAVAVAVPGDDGELWAGLVAAAGGILAANFGARSASAILAGAQLLPLVNVARIGQQLVGLATGYAFYRAGFGVVSLPLAEAFAALVLWAVLNWIVRIKCPWAGDTVTDPWHDFRPLLGTGALMALGGLGAILEYASDPFLLLAVCDDGLRVAAVYALWARLPGVAFSTCLTWGVSAIPSVASAVAGATGDAPRLIRRVLAVELGMGCLFAAGLAMWLPAVVRLWVGPAFDVENPVALAALFGGWVAARSRLTVLANVAYATNFAATGFGWLWAFAAVKISLGLVFAAAGGVVGLALASTASAIVVAVGFAFHLRARGVVPTSAAFAPALPLAFAAAGAAAGSVVGFPSLPATAIGIVLTGAALVVGLALASRVASGWGTPQ